MDFFSFVTFMGCFRATTFVCWVSLYRSFQINLSHVSLLYNTLLPLFFHLKSLYLIPSPRRSPSEKNRKTENGKRPGSALAPSLATFHLCLHLNTHTHDKKQNKGITLQSYRNIKKNSSSPPPPLPLYSEARPIQLPAPPLCRQAERQRLSIYPSF